MRFERCAVQRVFAFIAAVGLAGCSYDAATQQHALSSFALQPRHQISLGVLQARVSASERFFAQLVAGRVQPMHPYKAKLTNHGTVILRGGIEIPVPESSGKRHHISNANCNWSGNIPPPCDTTGPFRRVYSAPGGGAGTAYVTNQDPSSMPPNCGHGKGADTGYTYLEGWPGANTANSEFGLYLCTNGYGSGSWTAYLKTPNAYYQGVLTYPSGDYIGIFMAPTGSPYCNHAAQDCIAVTIVDYTCGGQESGCWEYWVEPDSGWIADCCILASMTTIAQNGGNDFTNGEHFGPGTWWGVYLQTAIAGEQRYPKDTTKIIVILSPEIYEGDIIDLHP